jgi:hypothetical protein
VSCDRAKSRIERVNVCSWPLVSKGHEHRSYLQRARFSEFDEALAIGLWKPKKPKSFVQKAEAGGLGMTHALSNLFQVLAVKRDKIADELDIAGFARRCRFLAIDPPLDIGAPFLRILFGGEMSR